MFKGLYDSVVRLSRHRHAPKYLAIVSFAESSFFPVPPDIMLAPMVLGNRKRAWRLAGLTTVASVAGGIFGYYLGGFGEWLVNSVNPFRLQGQKTAALDATSSIYRRQNQISQALAPFGYRYRFR